MKSMLILIAALLLSGCAPTEEKTAATKASDAQAAAIADKAAVDKIREEFLTAFNAGDAAKVGDLYAEDAVQMPGDGSPTLNGRAAIVARNKGLFEQFTAKIAIRPSRTQVSGDLAYDEGTYTFEATPKKAGSKPMPAEEGRYVIVLHREPGGWKVIEDIDNVSKPVAPPAANKK